jgi:hypothetical protein
MLLVYETKRTGSGKQDCQEKKVFEKVAPDLKTDGTGQVVWKDVLAKTSAGVVKAHNGMAGAQVA